MTEIANHAIRHRMRLMLVGLPDSVVGQAARIASAAGAQASIAHTHDEALEFLRLRGADLVLADIGTNMVRLIAGIARLASTIPVIACGVAATPIAAVAAIRAGARDFIPLPPDAALIGAALASVAARQTKLVAEDPAFIRTLRIAQALAMTHSPVLLRGEMGTGRETLARSIHQHSGRRGPFIVCDCHADDGRSLGQSLFGRESEDGHAIGQIAEASGGTLYLRGIAHMPSDLRIQLLNALRQQPIRNENSLASSGAPVGPPRVVASIDIQAVDHTLDSELNRYFAGGTIDLPPLRERAGDIIPIARSMLAEIAEAHRLPQRFFSLEARKRVSEHNWPGNLHELRSILLQASLACHGELIDTIDLNLANAAPITGGKADNIKAFVGHTVADVERDLILSTLSRCGGNRTSASSVLGISVRTMRNKLKMYVEAGMQVEPAR